MFDIAFSELLIIGVIALVVIGPERLPKVARTVGSWLGKLNRYVAQVKQDIDRDMQLEELRKLQEQMKSSAQKYELMAEEASKKIKDEVGQVDKVMQAMAATDGGLALQEYEKIKAEQAAASEAEPKQEEPAESTVEVDQHGQADAPTTEPTANKLADAEAPDPDGPAAEFSSSLEGDIKPDDMTADSKPTGREQSADKST